MRLIMFFIISASFFFSCKKTPPAPKANVIIPEGFDFNGMTPAMAEQLIQGGDHIDYMFNDFPLSMNQEGQSSVYQDLNLISPNPINGITEGCVPLARKIYLGKGEIITEADLYFSNGCMFQVFLDNEKPVFGNFLSQSGISYYTQLMEQAKQSMPAELRRVYEIPSQQ